MTKYSDTVIGKIVEELLEREAKGKREAAYGRALRDVLQMYANLDEAMSLITKSEDIDPFTNAPRKKSKGGYTGRAIIPSNHLA